MGQDLGVAVFLVVYLLSKELLPLKLLSPIPSQSRDQITKEATSLLTTRKTKAKDPPHKPLLPRYPRVRQIRNIFWGNVVIKSREIQSKTWTERVKRLQENQRL